jgi:hypothetical protein
MQRRMRLALFGVTSVVVVVLASIGLRSLTVSTSSSSPGAGGPSPAHTGAVMGDTDPTEPTFSAGHASGSVSGRSGGASVAGGPTPSRGAAPASARPTGVADSSGRTAARPTGDVVVDWIANLGPLGGGATGQEETAFTAFATGDCAAFSEPLIVTDEPAATVFHGAYAACRVVSGDPTRWADLAQAVADLQPIAETFDCLEGPMYTIMSEMVRIHAANPAVTVHRSNGLPKPLRCPQIAKVTPDHGSRTTDTLVAFVGENLPARVRVHILFDIGDEQIVDVALAGQRGTLILPGRPDKKNRGMTIWPDGWPFAPTNTADFEYDD